MMTQKDIMEANGEGFGVYMTNLYNMSFLDDLKERQFVTFRYDSTSTPFPVSFYAGGGYFIDLLNVPADTIARMVNLMQEFKELENPGELDIKKYILPFSVYIRKYRINMIKNIRSIPNENIFSVLGAYTNLIKGTLDGTTIGVQES